MLPPTLSFKHSPIPSALLLLGINTLAVVLFLISLGNLGGHWLHQEVLKQPWPTVENPFPTKEALPEDLGVSKEHFSEILDRNLFGAKRLEIPFVSLSNSEGGLSLNQPIEPKKEAKPLDTLLNIELRGTMVSPNAQASYALVANTKGQKERLFGVGECFTLNDLSYDRSCTSTSVKLVSVQNRQIEVMYQGQTGWLLMNRLADSNAGGAPPHNMQTNVEQNSSAAITSNCGKKQKNDLLNTEAVAPTSKVQIDNKPPLKCVNVAVSQVYAYKQNHLPQSGNDQTFNLSRVWVQEQIDNFTPLLQDASVRPIQKKGKPLFQFRYIKKGSLYETLGLRKNDIILSINDIVIDTLPKAMGLLNKLVSEREIALVVERNESPVTLRYFID